MNPKRPVDKPKSKRKDVAVFLALLTGPFGWLYVARDNLWKFFISMFLALLTRGFGLLIAWVWAIADLAGKPSAYYHGYGQEKAEPPGAKRAKYVESQIVSPDEDQD